MCSLPSLRTCPVPTWRKSCGTGNLIDRKGGFPCSAVYWGVIFFILCWFHEDPQKKPLWKQMGHSRGISSFLRSFILFHKYLLKHLLCVSFVTGLQLWAKQTQTLCSWSLQPVWKWLWNNSKYIIRNCEKYHEGKGQYLLEKLFRGNWSSWKCWCVEVRGRFFLRK